MSGSLQVTCPTCRKIGTWFADKHGPFCSQRCKLIDLGKWLTEEHTLSTPLRPEHMEDYAELPPGEHLDKPEPED